MTDALRPPAPARRPAPLPADPYAALAAAPDGAARTALLLRFLEAAAPGPLALPAQGEQRAVLDEVDLSPPSLQARLDGSLSGKAPVWWDAENNRADLRGADLRGASLRLSHLEQVDLTGSNLAAAALGGAHLQGAVLEKVDGHGVDLAGADLRGAQLGAANLEGALLEEANLREAGLRFARLEGSFLEGADLRSADLWSAQLASADLAGADLTGAVLNEADLRGADLTGANLSRANLNQAHLEAARLIRADLREADLTGASLRGAHLQDSRLDGLDLTRCDLTHVFLKGASLHRAQFACEQLGGAIGEELAETYEEARQGYLALERTFLEWGDPDVARWAYRKRRRMQKLAVRQQARAAAGERRWHTAYDLWGVYAGDQIVEWLCDYGESIGRVLASMLGVYLLFMLVYALTGSVVRVVNRPGGPVRVPTHRLIDLAVFSLLAMTTSGSPVVGLLPRSEIVQFLTGLEALLGIGLTGLLGFVAGNRIRR